MSKSKKTKKEKVEEVVVNQEFLQPTEETSVQLSEPKKFEQCEWCFQFDEDESQIFAWTDEQLNLNEDPKIIFTITNVEDSFISFTNAKTKKQFKIFVRELTEEGKNLRNQARLQMNILKNQENASENKEAQS